jgi:DnaJ-domain-containing protein 1
VHNDGRVAARRASVEVAWVRGGVRTVNHRADRGRIEPAGAARVAVKDPQASVPGAGWEALVVEARAWLARPAREELRVAERPRAPGAASASPVSYVRPHAAPCPAGPGGAHRFETRGFPNDGVVEQWELCRLCGAVRKLPLAPEQEATQARVRRARAAREAAKLEEELARAEAEAARRGSAPPPRHRRPERAPPPDAPHETLPASAAYWILGLPPTAGWDEVKAAHRRLAKEYHPDAAGAVDERTRALLDQRMRDVNAAKDRLREHLRPDEPERRPAGCPPGRPEQRAATGSFSDDRVNPFLRPRRRPSGW